jgi:hypothetical protein
MAAAASMRAKSTKKSSAIRGLIQPDDEQMVDVTPKPKAT